MNAIRKPDAPSEIGRQLRNVVDEAHNPQSAEHVLSTAQHECRAALAELARALGAFREKISEEAVARAGALDHV